MTQRITSIQNRIIMQYIYAENRAMMWSIFLLSHAFRMYGGSVGCSGRVDGRFDPPASSSSSSPRGSTSASRRLLSHPQLKRALGRGARRGPIIERPTAAADGVVEVDAGRGEIVRIVDEEVGRSSLKDDVRGRGRRRGRSLSG